MLEMLRTTIWLVFLILMLEEYEAATDKITAIAHVMPLDLALKAAMVGDRRFDMEAASKQDSGWCFV